MAAWVVYFQVTGRATGGSSDIPYTIFIVAVSFVGAGMVIWGAVPTSIGFDGTGITAYIFGVTWKSIGWDEVIEIDCRRNADPETGKKGEAFRIISARRKISFFSDMTNLDNLLKRLNYYIGEKHIPAFYLNDDSSHLPWFMQLRIPLFMLFYRTAKAPTSRFEA
jgi:hypothetical protein